MPIKKIEQNYQNVFGIEIEGKSTGQEVDDFIPEIEQAIRSANNKLRLLVDVSKAQGMHLKADWEMFEFLKHHIKDIDFVAIVGAHSIGKILDEIFVESVFTEAETLFFEEKYLDKAWEWLEKASYNPKKQPVRKYIHSNKGVFTKYSSPDYI